MTHMSGRRGTRCRCTTPANIIEIEATNVPTSTAQPIAFLRGEREEYIIPKTKKGKIIYHDNIVIASMMSPLPRSSFIGGGKYIPLNPATKRFEGPMAFVDVSICPAKVWRF
jgi:hypothetical protein